MSAIFGGVKADTKGRALLTICLWAAGVAVLIVVLRRFGLDVFSLRPDDVRRFMLSHGVLAPLIYLGVFSQPIIPLPVSVMMVAGGLAFGPFWGMVGAVSAATIRACGSFLIARRLGGNILSRLFKGRISSLNEKVAANSFKAVILLRFIPSVPFDLLNWGLGFSSVRFWPYTAATLLGLIPISFVFVYLGHSLSDLSRMRNVMYGILLLLAMILLQRMPSLRRQASQ